MTNGSEDGSGAARLDPIAQAVARMTDGEAQAASGMTPEQMEDAAHRMACLVKYGPGCCCAEYAAITALMHPDCPEHGYIIGRPKKETTRDRR